MKQGYLKPSHCHSRLFRGAGPNLIASLIAFALAGCAANQQDGTESAKSQPTAAAESPLYSAFNSITAENLNASQATFVSPQVTPVLDASGATLAFLEYGPTAPLAGDTNINALGDKDVYVRNRSTGAFSRMPFAIAAGERGDARIGSNAMSDSGQYVTLTAYTGPSLSSGSLQTQKILLWNRTTNQVTTIDQGLAVDESGAQSSISADGSTIGYSNINNNNAITLYNRAAGTKVQLKGKNGQVLNVHDSTQKPILSADGKLVFFADFADKVDSTLPHQNALFVVNVTTGAVDVQRIDSAGQPLMSAYDISVSADGRLVAFSSPELQLASDTQSPRGSQVYVFDRVTRKCTRLSVPVINGTIPPSGSGNDSSFSPVMSANGRRVVFLSRATNLLGDATTTQDAYAADPSTLELVRVNVGSNGERADGGASSVGMSSNGNVLCFETTATNLIGTGTNQSKIYCRTMADSPYIEGTVKGADDQGIYNVTVEAGGKTAVTDGSGHYVITGLPMGTYTVHAQLSGYTFGTDEYALQYRTVDLHKTARQDILGFKKPPIVFAPGYEDSGHIPRWTTLQGYGYREYIAPIDNQGLVPDKYSNARVLKDTINKAKAESGRDKVILVGYSMGGIISRAYLESQNVYDGDVAEFFDFGTPHWGYPTVLDPYTYSTAVLPMVLDVTTPGLMDMTQQSTGLFNYTHPDRAPSVLYHLIGGAAPMWRQICWRIPVIGSHICIPWPNLLYRNAGGWALGAAIWGDDDALFEVSSTVDLSGDVDRLVTNEVHIGNLGPRNYKDWDNGNESRTFTDCFRKVLINNQTVCGTRAVTASPSSYNTPALRDAVSIPGYTPSNDGPTFNAATQTSVGLLHANETIRRDLVVEGGQVDFLATWGAGHARVTLIDPTGKTYTPETAGSGMTEDTGTTPVATTVPNDFAAFMASGTSESYYFPNAVSGKWTMVITGSADIPSAGVPYTAAGQLSSTLTMASIADHLWYAAGSTVTLTVKLSESVQSASITGTVNLANGTTSTVTFSSIGNNQYRATYVIPTGAGGNAKVIIAATGKNKSGVLFERGGQANFQVMADTTTLSSAYSATREPSQVQPGKYHSILFNVGVQATAGTKVTVTATLVDQSGKVITRATVNTPVNPGANSVQLPFSGKDIFKSAVNGPYRITDLLVVEERATGPVVVAQQTNVFTTDSYPYTSFEGGLYQGHYYQAFSSYVTWPAAKAACEGQGAHLATIGSPGENDYISQLSASNYRSWIGFTDAAQEGVWQWTTGEAKWYKNWVTGEPNNGAGGTPENNAAIYGGSGGWTDLPGTWAATYICEWEAKPTQWTEWFDRDNPSGNGDNESLGYFTAAGQACAAPLAIECRRVSDKVAWDQTKNIMTCTPSGGGLCLNASQPNGVSCDDIEVRFLCPKP